MFFELDSQSKSRKKEDLFRNYAIMKMENKCEPSFEALVIISAADDPSDSQSVFTITEKAPTLGNCTTSQIKRLQH